MTVFIKYKTILKLLGAVIVALYIHLWFMKIQDETPSFHEMENTSGNNGVYNKDYITFVTYNVWCNYLVKTDHIYAERFDGFAQGVKDMDIVMVQEAFILRVGPLEFSKCASHMVTAMKSQGFKYHTSFAETVPYVFGQSNGIAIFSKIPFRNTKSVIFNTANMVERVNNKGFIYAELLINGRPMFIYNTHTDAHGEKYRSAQMKELTSYIISNPPSSYIIAGGDYNINPNNPPLDGSEAEYNNLVKMMDHVGLRPVFTERNATHLNGGCYDHVFISSNIAVDQRKVINLLTANDKMVSDHYGLFMKVKLSTPNKIQL